MKTLERKENEQIQAKKTQCRNLLRKNGHFSILLLTLKSMRFTAICVLLKFRSSVQDVIRVGERFHISLCVKIRGTFMVSIVFTFPTFINQMEMFSPTSCFCFGNEEGFSFCLQFVDSSIVWYRYFSKRYIGRKVIEWLGTAPLKLVQEIGVQWITSAHWTTLKFINLKQKDIGLFYFVPGVCKNLFFHWYWSNDWEVMVLH